MQGWPVFFYHRRLCLNCVPFIMVKFRTMTVGPSLSANHDGSRLTSWGRLLRRFSLDELPVLYNVIRGQMSLGGPDLCLRNMAPGLMIIKTAVMK